MVEGWWASNLIKNQALYSRAPLRKLLRESLKDDYLEEIANQYRKNRLLLVGVVNLDTGKFTVVNLTEVATKYTGEQRQEIFIDTLMASSAIPLIFPVEFLDGEMYIDGGAREYVFFNNIEKSINEAYLKEGITNVDKTFYMIVHGDFVLNDKCTAKSTIDIAKRSMSVVLDHNIRVSVFYNAFIANNRMDNNGRKAKSIEQNLWKIKVLSAKDHQCSKGSANSELFDPVFTECLYNMGENIGSSPVKEWITDIKKLAELVDESRRAEMLIPNPSTDFNTCNP